MGKVKEALNRKVGPFKLYVWVLILLGGFAIGVLLRLRNPAGADEGGDTVGVGGVPTLHGNGALGVPYPYLGDDRTAEERAADILEEGLMLLQDSWNTQQQILQEGYATSTSSLEGDTSYADPTLDPSAFTIKMSDGELVYGSVNDYTAEDLEGATIYAPRDSDLESTDIWSNVSDGRVTYGYQTDISDSPKLVSKPLENYIATATKNCERIQKNPEWYTAEQRAACGV